MISLFHTSLVITKNQFFVCALASGCCNVEDMTGCCNVISTNVVDMTEKFITVQTFHISRYLKLLICFLFQIPKMLLN